MAEQIEYRIDGGVAVITLSNPPINALSRPLRTDLIAGLERAEADDAVAAIVLIGAGRTFPAGLDVTEFDEGMAQPDLVTLCSRVEACAKPVIAALHGTILGAGFELALAAHYRITEQAARVALPEIKLGLMPSGGATQRAPRIAGAGVSLDLMLGGEVHMATSEKLAAFFDRRIAGDLEAAAISFARDMAAKGPRPTRDRRDGFADPAAFQAEIARRRGALTPGAMPAKAEIIGAVEASLLLPFEAGLFYEDEAFHTCLSSDVSKALRHAFLAERRVKARATPDEARARPFGRLCVLGGGPVASQLVLRGLDSGLDVAWGTRDGGVLKAGLTWLDRTLDSAEASKRMTSEARKAMRARLVAGDSAQIIREGDVVVHAARGQGDAPAPPGVMRFSAVPGHTPGVGLRFAPAVHVMRLVEVLEGPKATPDEIATALDLADRLGKIAVRVVSSGDSVGGRMMTAFHRAADALVDLGASPYAVDAAVRAMGWPRAPFAMRDALGLAEAAHAPRAEGAHNWSAELMAQGRKGRGQGGGFYADNGIRGLSQDPEVTRLIDSRRAPSDDWAPGRLWQVLLAALMNEGARILADNWVRYSSDIDTVMLLGQAFPRERGGVMYAADRAGLLQLCRSLETLGHVDRPFWTPHLLIRELIKNGLKFRDFDRHPQDPG